MAPTTVAAAALVLTMLPCLFLPARSFLPSQIPHVVHGKAFAMTSFGSATSPPQQRHEFYSRCGQLYMTGEGEDGSAVQGNAKREVRLGIDRSCVLVDTLSRGCRWRSLCKIMHKDCNHRVLISPVHASLECRAVSLSLPHLSLRSTAKQSPSPRSRSRTVMVQQQFSTALELASVQSLLRGSEVYKRILFDIRRYHDERNFFTNTLCK